MTTIWRMMFSITNMHILFFISVFYWPAPISSGRVGIIQDMLLMSLRSKCANNTLSKKLIRNLDLVIKACVHPKLTSHKTHSISSQPLSYKIVGRKKKKKKRRRNLINLVILHRFNRKIAKKMNGITNGGGRKKISQVDHFRQMRRCHHNKKTRD